LNVEAYPNSANTYDSLSDAYLVAGNTVKALEFARKALEALPRDKTAPDDFKQQICESAEAKIRQLGSSLQ
jgi:tetratricopeptide (TPR) repeat protein